jgi:hypothetical protein
MTASMGRRIRPQPPYFSHGVVTCPDCGRLYWGSAVCTCGAALHGPRRTPHYIDAAIARHWLIAADGSANLLGAPPPAGRDRAMTRRSRPTRHGPAQLGVPIACDAYREHARFHARRDGAWRCLVCQPNSDPKGRTRGIAIDRQQPGDR